MPIYNNEAFGRAAETIASMFAPPSASDVSAYSTAALNRQKKQQLEQLFGAGKTPSEQAALTGVQGYGQTPQGFTYEVDQNNATQRANNAADNARAITTNQLDNRTDLLKTRFGSVSQDAMLPAMPQSIADMYGLPALPAVQGNRSPLSETEWDASQKERLRQQGGLTDQMLIDAIVGERTPVETVGPDGTARYMTPGEAARTGAEVAPKTPLVSMGGERAWDVESAKLFAKQYADINGQAGVAQEMLGLLGAAESALSSGVYQGLAGDQVLDLQRLGTALGLENAESVAGGELVRAIQNRMALLMRNPESGMGMPGAVSDRDILFLKQAQPGLSKTPEGNRQLLGMLAAMERRKIEIANLADRYVQENGRLDVGFNQAVRDYAEANPLFPSPNAGTGAQAGAASGGEAYAVNPETGQRVVFRDGRWQPAQ